MIFVLTDVIDYVSTSVLLTFDHSVTVKNIRVPLVNNLAFELTETFATTISQVTTIETTRVTVSEFPDAVVVILDDDSKQNTHS